VLDNKGFDMWANSYDKSVNLADENNEYPFAGYRNILNAIFNAVMKNSPAKVLDIGIGTGTLSTKLYENGNFITGVDFSKEMLEISKNKMPDARFFDFDFSDGLPSEINGEEFDFIVSTYAIHHIDDAMKIKFITSLLDRLESGGKIYIGDVSFLTKEELEKCKEDFAEDFDDEEFYFVFSDIESELQKNCKVQYHKFSHCAGILEISAL